MLQRRPRDRRRRQVHQLLPQRLIHPIRQARRRGHQDRPRVRVVLRLRQQIGSDQRRIRRLVRQDHELARPGQHVDAHLTGDQLLRRRDPAVPGPDHHVASGTAPAPYASAAIAWAPPAASTASAPAIHAAANVTGDGRGDATHTSPTPATRAVTAVIRTELGNGNRPPGA